VFTVTEMETQYTLRHNTLMLHNNTLCVTVHQNHHWVHLINMSTLATCIILVRIFMLLLDLYFETVILKGPDYGSDELQHVAHCCVALQCFI